MFWAKIFLIWNLYNILSSYGKETSQANKNPIFIIKFYEGCYDTKRCFGLPEGCIKNSSCKAAVAVTVEDDEYIFELIAPPPASQVVTGLSFDAKMGDDSVMYCHKNVLRPGTTHKHNILATTGYTTIKAADSNTHAGQIKILDRSNANGYIYCKLKRYDNIYAGEYTFDLQNTKYHLMVCASSEEQKGLLLSKHNIIHGVDDVKTYLIDVSNMSLKSKILYRFHGSLMLIYWLGLAPICIILERYYQSFYSKYRNIIAIISIFTNYLSLILVLIGVNGWSDQGTAHGISGIITILLFSLQCLFVFIKKEFFTVRKIVMANITTAFGYITCALAGIADTAQLPKWAMWLQVVMLFITVGFNIALSVFTTNLVTPKSSNTNNILDHQTPMNRMITNLYIICTILFILVLLPFVAFAPIYNVWQ